MKQFGLILFIVSMFFMLSCSQRPNNVLSKKEMMDVLYDLQLAQAMYNDQNIEVLNTQEGKDALLTSVLTKYNLSQADLDSSVVWYSDNLGEYKIINDSVVQRLRRRLSVLREEDNALRGVENTGNNTIPRYFYLTKSDSKRTFFFQESDLQEEGGLANFRLKFNTLGFNGEDRQIETGVYFVYKDTTVVNKMTIQKDSLYIVEKPNLPDSLLNQIKGYFLLPQSRIFMPLKLYNVEYIDKRTDSEKESDSDESSE